MLRLYNIESNHKKGKASKCFNEEERRRFPTLAYTRLGYHCTGYASFEANIISCKYEASAMV